MIQSKEKPSIVTGWYRHYKGNIYFVLDVAQNAETGQWCVVYLGEQLWIRPLDHFIGWVQVDDQLIQRYCRI